MVHSWPLAAHRLLIAFHRQLIPSHRLLIGALLGCRVTRSHGVCLSVDGKVWTRGRNPVLPKFGRPPWRERVITTAGLAAVTALTAAILLVQVGDPQPAASVLTVAHAQRFRVWTRGRPHRGQWRGGRRRGPDQMTALVRRTHKLQNMRPLPMTRSHTTRPAKKGRCPSEPHLRAAADVARSRTARRQVIK